MSEYFTTDEIEKISVKFRTGSTNIESS